MTTKTNTHLEPGDVIIGDAGGHTTITGNVYPSSTSPGLLVVETEHGALYVDPEGESEVA